MSSTEIFQDDLKEYTISRLDFLSTSADGIQTKNRTPLVVEIAVYDKGMRLVRKTNEDDYPISTIHIYSHPNVLKILDTVPFKGLDHTVLEEKSTADYSFFRAVANV